jgi:hypothetical protein
VPDAAFRAEHQKEGLHQEEQITTRKMADVI